MDIISVACEDKIQTDGKLSIPPTVRCEAYNATLSVWACAMRHVRAISYDRRKTKRCMKSGVYAEIQVNSVHCLSCEEGKKSLDATPQARGRGKRILDAYTGSKLSRAMRGSNQCTAEPIKGIGYTTGELRKHIENQFKPGMNWENYTEWEIDHIIPKSAFSYKSDQDAQFRQCWALKNLQPLWVAENHRKHSKIATPF